MRRQLQAVRQAEASASAAAVRLLSFSEVQFAEDLQRRTTDSSNRQQEPVDCSAGELLRPSPLEDSRSAAPRAVRHQVARSSAAAEQERQAVLAQLPLLRVASRSADPLRHLQRPVQRQQPEHPPRPRLASARLLSRPPRVARLQRRPHRRRHQVEASSAALAARLLRQPAQPPRLPSPCSAVSARARPPPLLLQHQQHQAAADCSVGVPPQRRRHPSPRRAACLAEAQPRRLLQLAVLPEDSSAPSRLSLLVQPHQLAPACSAQSLLHRQHLRLPRLAVDFSARLRLLLEARHLLLLRLPHREAASSAALAPNRQTLRLRRRQRRRRPRPLRAVVFLAGSARRSLPTRRHRLQALQPRLPR